MWRWLYRKMKKLFKKNRSQSAIKKPRWLKLFVELTIYLYDRHLIHRVLVRIVAFLNKHITNPRFAHTDRKIFNFLSDVDDKLEDILLYVHDKCLPLIKLIVKILDIITGKRWSGGK